MGVPSPYTPSAINTTDEGKKIDELGEDIHEMQWVDWPSISNALTGEGQRKFRSPVFPFSRTF